MALTSTQVSLPHAPVLSRVETHRVIAVLEKAVERLHLLAMLDEQDSKQNAAATASGTAKSATQHSGDGTGEEANRGVGSILEEQKQLEARYEQLIAATQKKRHNPMDPLLDPTCFSHVRNFAEEAQIEELHEVSKRLKEQSRLLCRQLKDNPNDAENWRKIVGERAEVCMQLNSCVSELQATGQSDDREMGIQGQQQGSYEQFAKKVEEEKVAADWAEQLVRLEKETNQNVKKLQNDVKTERAEKERDLEKRHKTIAGLKTDLRKLKQEVKERMERFKAGTDSETEGLKRKALDEQRVLNDRLRNLAQMIQNEEEVTGAMTEHIENKIQAIESNTAHWEKKQAAETSDLEMRERETAQLRSNLGGELASAKDELTSEEVAFKQRERAKADAAAVKASADARASAKYAAATKLQASIKGFFTRNALVVLKKKAGKKKKK